MTVVVVIVSVCLNRVAVHLTTILRINLIGAHGTETEEIAFPTVAVATLILKGILACHGTILLVTANALNGRHNPLTPRMVEAWLSLLVGDVEAAAERKDNRLQLVGAAREVGADNKFINVVTLHKIR